MKLMFLWLLKQIHRRGGAKAKGESKRATVTPVELVGDTDDSQAIKAKRRRRSIWHGNCQEPPTQSAEEEVNFQAKRSHVTDKRNTKYKAAFGDSGAAPLSTFQTCSKLLILKQGTTPAVEHCTEPSSTKTHPGEKETSQKDSAKTHCIKWLKSFPTVISAAATSRTVRGNCLNH
ncbi:hypothetical protein GOBAR_DD28210 [Gossypium barbadense]|nr:hypothetical protein GOBAR_DD28210 [Gossypium barbadense]